MRDLSRRRAESEVGHDEKDVHLVEERFEAMYEFADRTLDLYGPHRALAHHLLAATATELGDVEDAIHHVRACTTLLPQEQAFTSDLIARLQRVKRDGAIRLGPRLRSSCERAGEA